MVGAYGPVNKQLRTATFPSADVVRAHEIASGCSHHTLIDAIWGYTQFLLDDDTRKLLVVCHRSGLYEWLRMPFGPAPAPALMQQYVSESFSNLRTPSTGQPFCTPCMDDVVCSHRTLDQHIKGMQVLFETARKKGFEFKYDKGQYNQESFEFWGSI